MRGAFPLVLGLTLLTNSWVWSIASAAELSGRVVGYPHGQPLADVQVLVMDRFGQAAVGTTNAEGRYLVGQVDPGMQRVRALPPHSLNRIGAWYRDQYFFCSADTFVLTPDQALSAVDFALPVGGLISGRVLQDGVPVADAEVLAEGLDFFSSSLRRAARSDAEGNYRIGGLDSVRVGSEDLPGNYRISVRVPGAASWYYPGSFEQDAAVPIQLLRGEEQFLNLVPPEPSVLRGQLLDTNGAGVPGAVVKVDAGAFSRTVQGGPSGFFEFEHLVAGSLLLTATAPGMAQTWYPGVELAAGAAALELNPGETRSVELQMLPEAKLEVRIEGAVQEGARLVLRSGDGGDQLHARTLSAGASDAPVLLRGLPPGPAWLELLPAPGSMDSRARSSQLSLQRGGLVRAELGIEPGASLFAHVRRRGGLPLRGARLELFAVDQLDQVLAAARSDGAGRIELHGVSPAEVLVRVSVQPFCEGDPSSVALWWPDARSREAAGTLLLEPGDARELGEFVLAPDGDGDGMDDLWELAWGLEPNRADQAEDPDGDGIDNLAEYRSHSDPLGVDPQGQSCQVSAGSPERALWPLVLLLGLICRIRSRVPEQQCEPSLNSVVLAVARQSSATMPRPRRNRSSM
ncbi:MAG: hypothetical protein CMP23_17590 [Rickettsiales bacterium]|nr:hypothetical protein [Rickettsiales bacterium]